MTKRELVEFYSLVIGGFLIGGSAVIWSIPFWLLGLLALVLYTCVEVAISFIKED